MRPRQLELDLERGLDGIPLRGLRARSRPSTKQRRLERAWTTPLTPRAAADAARAATHPRAPGVNLGSRTSASAEPGARPDATYL